MNSMKRIISIITILCLVFLISHFADAEENLYVKALDAGAGHTVVLKNDGSVCVCGDNYLHQLAQNDKIIYLSPVKVEGLNDIIDVKAGKFHSLALKKDGSVWSWGYNSDGELGSGTDENSVKPEKIKCLKDIVQINANGNVSMALNKRGIIYMWGYNYSGQLGDGTTENSNKPVRVKGICHVKKIYTSGVTSFAIKSDNSVWAWGANNAYQFSTSTDKANSVTPIKIPNMENVIDISPGSFHTLALKKDGTVWAWGYNNRGELGNDYANSKIIRKVDGIDNVKSIHAGLFTSDVVKNDGSLWHWGSNQILSFDYANYSNIPLKYPNLSDIEKVGISKLYNFKVALDKNGKVWGYGYNQKGQLGNGTCDNCYNFSFTYY